MVDLISVVVPAYNAQSTLSETLSSVRAQTHKELEIVVVDDGSTDQTLSVAEVHAALDPRIRVLSTANGGVASARNAGIAASRGRFVAPIDADDLWHPDKIKRQLAVMESSGPEMGFVYTLFRRIDQNGFILDSCPDARFEGRVFLQMLLHNFVSNGSSLLIRREAFEAAGGYEPELRQRLAQGCEDYLLQLLIARHWLVGCVPEYLTAYRTCGASMSADKDQMTRSHVAMLDCVRRRFPETPAADLAASEAAVRARNAAARARRLRVAGGASELWHALRLDARTGGKVAAFTAMQVLRGTFARRVARLGFSPSRPKQHFLDADPMTGPKTEPLGSLKRQLAQLAIRDLDFSRPEAPVPTFRPAHRTGRGNDSNIGSRTRGCDYDGIDQGKLHGQFDEPGDGPGYGGSRVCR